MRRRGKRTKSEEEDAMDHYVTWRLWVVSKGRDDAIRWWTKVGGGMVVGWHFWQFAEIVEGSIYTSELSCVDPL